MVDALSHVPIYSVVEEYSEGGYMAVGSFFLLKEQIKDIIIKHSHLTSFSPRATAAAP
jgi:hypothetical protein